MTERYLRSVRLLAQCMQGFERHSNEHVRRFDLTPPQFDIIATLGNTAGMSCKELGDKTLITKGTLTGVLNRLEEKKLLERIRSNDDRRSIFVKLTAAGQQLFETVFPQVIAQGKLLFADYDERQFAELEEQLTRLKQRIDAQGAA